MSVVFWQYRSTDGPCRQDWACVKLLLSLSLNGTQAPAQKPASWESEVEKHHRYENPDRPQHSSLHYLPVLAFGNDSSIKSLTKHYSVPEQRIIILFKFHIHPITAPRVVLYDASLH